MLKNSENNGTEEIGLVTPPQDPVVYRKFPVIRCGNHVWQLHVHKPQRTYQQRADAVAAMATRVYLFILFFFVLAEFLEFSNDNNDLYAGKYQKVPRIGPMLLAQ